MRRLVSLNPSVRCLSVDSAAYAGGASGQSHRDAANWMAVIRQNGLDVDWQEIPSSDRVPGNQPDLATALGNAAEAAIARGKHPVVLAGGVPIADAAWQGIARALGTRPGVIVIDARRQVNEAKSDFPGLGDGSWCVLVNGATTGESGERAFGKARVQAQGLAAVFAEAVQCLAPGPWGIRLLLDEPDIGDNAREAEAGDGRLGLVELAQVLRGVLRQREFVALEILGRAPEHAQGGQASPAIQDLLEAASAPDGATLQRWEAGFGARNYAPMPVVLHEGKGCWLTDVDGRRYLDMMSAYSATSFGHAHPRILAALTGQAQRLAVTSRAFSNDRLPQLLRRLAMMSGYDRVLPANTGLEAVETALKAARKWAVKVKGVPDNKAEIIACRGNFHGRSIAILGLSSEKQYRDGFGPFPPGMKLIPYGDAAALAAAITPNTAAFLVEPIQGEGGIILPPPGYLATCSAICKRQGVLLLVDEVQTGLGRTGKLFAYQHEAVRPDGVIIGKALGGGLLPVSAFLADEAVMRVFTPGDHGSTFGGNPLACSVALAALDVLEDEQLVEKSARLGELLMRSLHQVAEGASVVRAVRGKGLFAGIELDPQRAEARKVAEALLAHGVLTKETHETVLRLAPPLVIEEGELAWGLARIAEVLKDFSRHRRLVA